MSASGKKPLEGIATEINEMKDTEISLNKVLRQLQSAQALSVIGKTDDRDVTAGKMALQDALEAAKNQFVKRVDALVAEVKADTEMPSADRNKAYARLENARGEAEKLVGKVAQKHDSLMLALKSKLKSDSAAPLRFGIGDERKAKTEAKSKPAPVDAELAVQIEAVNKQLLAYAQSLAKFSTKKEMLEGSDRAERRRLAGVGAGKLQGMVQDILKNGDWKTLGTAAGEAKDLLDAFSSRVAIDKKVKPADMGKPIKGSSDAIKIHNDFVSTGKEFFSKVVVAAAAKKAPELD